MVGRLIEFGGSKNNYFRRNIYYKLDSNYNEQVQSFKQEYNNTDIYNTVYSYDSTNIEESNLLGPFYLDYDSEDIDNEFSIIRREVYQTIKYLERVWNIPNNMICLYFSGAKGFHVVVPHEIISIAPDKDLNIKYKKIAQLVVKECNLTHLDISIYDKRRLFRIPNSINSKTGLFKIPLSLDMLMKNDFNNIKQMATQPNNIQYDAPIKIAKACKYYNMLFTKSSKQSYVYKKDKVLNSNVQTYSKRLLPCIQYILESSVRQGKRNSTTVVLASSLLQLGKSLKEVFSILEEWNKYNEPPLSDAELGATIVSANKLNKHDKYYGCTAIRNLNLCLGKECPLYNKN